MSFKSDAQRRFMYANHPDIARRWSKEHPNQGDLPDHVSDPKEGTKADRTEDKKVRRRKPKSK